MSLGTLHICTPDLQGERGLRLLLDIGGSSKWRTKCRACVHWGAEKVAAEAKFWQNLPGTWAEPSASQESTSCGLLPQQTTRNVCSSA